MLLTAGLFESLQSTESAVQIATALAPETGEIEIETSSKTFSNLRIGASDRSVGSSRLHLWIGEKQTSEWGTRNLFLHQPLLDSKLVD